MRHPTPTPTLTSKAVGLLAVCSFGALTSLSSQATLAVTDSELSNPVVADGTFNTVITNWFDEAGGNQFSSFIFHSTAEFGAESTQLLAFGPGNGYVYQSLGTRGAGEEIVSVILDAYERPNNQRFFPTLEIDFYAGAFGNAANGTDIGATLASLGTLTLTGADLFTTPLDASDGESQLGFMVPGSVDLSGVAVGTEIWMRLHTPDATGVTSAVYVDNITLQISGKDSLALEVESNGADLVFTWPSQAGKVYDLLTSIDPENDGDPTTWAVVANQEDIAAIPPNNTLTITRPVDGKRFYAIREENAPPPPPIFEDDFESGDTGWSTSNDGVAGTDWVLGNPTGGINNGPPSAFSPDNCYGTNILTDYGGEADVSLFSPVIAIPAGGATLRYQFWIDTETGPIPDPPDFGTLNILDADNGDALLETLEAEILGFPLAWDQAEYVLPASANDKNVKFQFRFVSDAGGANSNFGGWYIDDFEVAVE